MNVYESCLLWMKISILCFCSKINWVLMVAGIVSCIAFEKNPRIKAMIGYFPILIIAGIVNPISYKIISKIATVEIVAYTCKLMSIVPTLYCIAYSYKWVLEKITKRKMMAISFVALIVFIVVAGEMPSKVGIANRENLAEVPNDVYQLSELLEDKQDKKIMAPIILTSYIREIDPTIELVYGRTDNNEYSFYAECLNYDDPDANYVVDYCRENKCRYVVAFNSNKAITSFNELGCELIGYTNDYVVFDIINAEYEPTWKKASIR